MKKVTAIFDIGKTNKKLFLFDQNYKVVHKEYKSFDEIEDEDGYPCDDISAIKNWAISSFNDLLVSNQFEIQALNFSSYGASLVHIDQHDKVLTPLYNYTKPIDQSYIEQLYNTYGGVNKISAETASPPSGMLNSGIQLYWLKYHQPDVYSKVKYSLHLPQYLSYVFTNKAVSDHTSIGCHTMLWDYTKGKYHDWVVKESLDTKLAPIVDTSKSVSIDYKGKKIKIGTGIHDSSSSLVPYLMGDSNPFILLSTGTWSVSLNPSSNQAITPSDIEKNCLNYMTINGNRVRASRLFIGNEYKHQVEKLSDHFGKPKDHHKTILFSSDYYLTILKKAKNYFCFTSLNNRPNQPSENNYDSFPNFEYGYHQLMFELMEQQISAIELALSDSPLEKIYIDGGFSDNDLFVKSISHHFNLAEVITSKAANGSAIGAALMINNPVDGKAYFEENYGLKIHPPLNLNN